MNFYSTAFLAAIFAVFVILLAISTALREHRLRTALHSEHIKFKDGERYGHKIFLSLSWIVMSSVNLFLNLWKAQDEREYLLWMPEEFFSRLDYEHYYAHLTRYDGQIRFYLVMLILFVIEFLMFLLYRHRYSGTYFTEKGILRSGSFYKCENITYGFDNYIILIYNRKGRQILKITTADSGELDAAREFLGKYYTCISERENFYAEA